MKNREFCMLAHKYDPQKIIAGWWMSEKLDGMRAIWLPQTRGVKKVLLPWANHSGDERYVNPPVATGLWSRYGNVIHAPDWWLDNLPKHTLDGELYIPGHRQHMMSVVKKLEPCDGWRDVKYYAFDSPPTETMMADGRIYSPNYKKIFRDEYFEEPEIVTPTVYTYRYRYRMIQESEVVVPHVQTVLPFAQAEALVAIDQALEEVTSRGGEGLIIRNPDVGYECKRTRSLVKVKPLDDAEGVVIGYTSGRKTDLGSKHLGRMGALVLKLESGALMELSGFTDAEREFDEHKMVRFAINNPGVMMPEWIVNSNFPIGSQVTFKYRGLTADGIPQEARYWRKR